MQNTFTFDGFKVADEYFMSDDCYFVTTSSKSDKDGDKYNLEVEYDLKTGCFSFSKCYDYQNMPCNELTESDKEKIKQYILGKVRESDKRIAEDKKIKELVDNINDLVGKEVIDVHHNEDDETMLDVVENDCHYQQYDSADNVIIYLEGMVSAIRYGWKKNISSSEIQGNR